LHLTSEIFTSPAQAVRTGGGHLFWSDNISESLKNSIEEFGQSAPVLVYNGEHGPTLAAGSARLAVLDGLGRPVLARMVEGEDAVSLGLLYLADNAHRQLDDAMRFKALQYFAPLLEREALEQDILPRLGVRAKSKDARLLLDWLALPEPWRELLGRGTLPLAAGMVLARMDEADRDAVMPLFADMAWSRSNAVNVLTWLYEAARMAGCPVAEVMDKAGMPALLDQGLSPKDAIARLCAVARQARHPELTRLRDRFDAAARTVTGGTAWKLAQPDNFETNGAELSVRVKDREQLARAVQALQSMADNPAWETVFRPGGDNE
jgi:ParB family chromosome partitioning protein